MRRAYQLLKIDYQGEELHDLLITHYGAIILATKMKRQCSLFQQARMTLDVQFYKHSKKSSGSLWS